MGTERCGPLPTSRTSALACAISAAPGDLIICMGAGDITKWAGGLADRLRAPRARSERRYHPRSPGESLPPSAPLAPLVWFKSGGNAEWLFEPKDEEDLRASSGRARPGGPGHGARAGSNMIVRDGGIPGVVIRLGKAFSKIEKLDDVTLRCGGGASGIFVSLHRSRRRHCGAWNSSAASRTVGGFVRMNGGAYGREVQDILLIEARVNLRDGRIETHARQARLHLPTQRSAGRIGRDRGHLPRYAGKPRSHRGGDGRDRPRPRGIAPLRSRTGGSTFKNPPAHKAGPWSMRRAAVPSRSAALRSRKALQLPAQSRYCHQRRHRGAGRKSDAGCWKLGITLEWEIQRIGMNEQGFARRTPWAAGRQSVRSR